MLSNQYNPLPISKGDRRIFYIHSKVTKRDAHYYGRLKNWMDNENGKWHFKKYLKDEIVPLLDEQNKDHRNFAFVELFDEIHDFSRRLMEFSRNFANLIIF